MTLRVTLEVVPFGKEGKKFKIGHMDISNMGTYDGKDYEYSAKQFTEDGELKIESVDGSLAHRRDDGPWWLVRKALQLKGFVS